MQHCPSCRREMPGTAHFCGNCGYELNEITIKIWKRYALPAPASLKPFNTSAGSTSVSRAPRRHAVLNRLPEPLRRSLIVLFVRARDTEPEALSIRQSALQKARTGTTGGAGRNFGWGWLPLLTLVSALGLSVIAFAYTSARNGGPAELFFWVGLLLIFVPTTIRLISPWASSAERMWLICMVGIALYLVKVMFSPLYFSYFDEFLHWHTVNDIANTGHLFSNNPLLPVSPFYPGLEIVTDALAKLSGLNTFVAGTIVVGVARIMMVMALFMLYELITKSARVAGIAMIIYMTNPHFLFFDAQFAYESLALPLATLILFALARYETLHNGRRWMALVACVLLGVVVVTHHVTNYVFDAFVLLWAAIYALQYPTWKRRVQTNGLAHARTRPRVFFLLTLLCVALFGAFASIAWMNVSGNPVVNYLLSAFINDFNQIGRLLSGNSAGRQFFVAYSGQATPLWERFMTLSSVALITLSLPFGLLCFWLRYRANALIVMFGLVSLCYPVSQILRVTNSGAEISDRASAFLFLAVAFVMAIFITQFWPVQRLRWQQTSLLTTIIAILFLGGIILGNGSGSTILPGAYRVAADERSIEPEGIQSALWADAYLGPGNRLTTDRTNQLLMSVYGEQRPVTPIEDTIDEGSIFFSSSMNSYEIGILRQNQVRYIVVDRRLSTALPYLGFYFDEGEPGAFQYTMPIPLQDLTKFNTVPQINRVFDSGNIVIYDAGGLLHAP